MTEGLLVLKLGGATEKDDRAAIVGSIAKFSHDANASHRLAL